MIESPNPIPAAQLLFGYLLSSTNVHIRIRYDASGSLCDDDCGGKTDEKSVLLIAQTQGEFEVQIRCTGEKGAFYALCEIDRRIRNGALCAGTVTLSPSFAVRGYIEGFYGVPWTHAQRLTMMERMAKCRMNTVFYAPKDDPYHRERWAALYPAGELNRLRALSEHARRLYMDLYWCVAPGLSITYSDPADFERLCEKTEQVFGLGVRCFGLLLDDVPETLRHEEDRERYVSIAKAHTDLICRYYHYLKKLDADTVLAVCPLVYHGAGSEPYITELGGGIPEDVLLFWTGKDICSRELIVIDAAKFTLHTGHRPLYWDNYPVNDEAMFREMHLGPVIGRDPGLARLSHGLIANCMQYAECSCIPLSTVADYTWDSENYDPEASFEFAIREAVGEENAQAFLTFADHLYTSCLLNDNSRRLISVLYGVAGAVCEHRNEEAAAQAEAYRKQMENSLRFLSGDLPILYELRPWIKKYTAACGIINRLLDYILSPSHDAMRAEISAMIDAYAADPTVLIHEFVFREILLDRYLL